MKLFTLQGLPGSGKSEWCRRNFPGLICPSADHYFIKNGVFQFDPSKIGLAHQACFRDFLNDLNSVVETIVIDNTNLTTAEIAPYYLAGESLNYDVQIVRLVCEPETAWKRQTHGVPFRTFAHMVANFDNFKPLPWWKVKEVSTNV